MKKNIKIILFSLSILIICFVGFVKFFLLPKFIEPLNLSGTFSYDSLKIDGKRRDFYLYNPNKNKASTKLIIAFHPATENGIYMRKITAYSLDSVADKENIFICYPNAYYGYWNDKLTEVTSKAASENVNETSFIRTIQLFIETKYHVELKNTYLIGLSQGGEMVYRLCIDIPNKITAATVVAANLSVKKNMRLDSLINPVSMLIINGKKDPLCPYEGGEVNFHNIIKRGNVYSAKTTAAFWAKCAGYHSATSIDSIIDKKNTKVATIINYEIKDKKNVCLYSIINGGHTFPNPRLNSAKLFGETNHDINASNIAWTFFKKNTVE